MTPLASKIAGHLQDGSSMPFSSFMAAALYDAGYGYYTSGTARLGRGGDFFTSVSVGPVFGQLMAREFCAAWEGMGKPSVFTLIEAGANDGQFALDVLSWISVHRPDFFEALCYQIEEPWAPVAARQRQTLAAFSGRLSHDAMGPAAQGCFFANELLDAVPCRRVRFSNGLWHELHVGFSPENGGQFHWLEREPEDTSLRRRLAWLGNEFPDGYCTEIAPAVASHLRLAASRLEQGYFFFADYGYPAWDYYAPHRINGTLRCYRNHRAHEDPFDAIGGTDITAHVDFSFAATAAMAAGCEVLAFLDQARFLTAVAAPALQDLERAGPAPASGWQRQFQTLTHPAHLGQQFYFLVLGKNVHQLPPLPGLAFARPAAVAELLEA